MGEPVGGEARPTIAVVDTMLVSAILVGRRRKWAADLLGRYEAHLRGISIVLSFATVSELRYGSLKAGMGVSRMQYMEDWFRDVATIVMPDNDLVNTCANLRYECFKATHPLIDKIHDSDRWIASTAIRHGVPLISDDRIFRGVPGLTLIQEDVAGHLC
jgi:predicted nucleic acid-binding protein